MTPCKWCPRPSTTRLVAAVDHTDHGPVRRYLDLCGTCAEGSERERERVRRG